MSMRPLPDDRTVTPLRSDRPRRSRSAANYVNRHGLENCLRRAIHDHAPRTSSRTILDLACGERLYEPYFGNCVQYVGLDLERGAQVDVYARAESLPFRHETFDVVLCTQVLEHVAEPPAVISEVSRVLKPGGVLFLSTHGSMVFHPTPDDHWRWTQTGLRRILTHARRLDVLAIHPVAGTFSSLAFLNAWYADLLLRKIERRSGLLTFAPRILRRAAVFGLNATGSLLDRLLPDFSRIERPNTLFVSFLAVCRRSTAHHQNRDAGQP